MRIEVFHRENGSTGVYISGDLAGEVPTSLRVVQPDGKSEELYMEPFIRKGMKELWLDGIINYAQGTRK